MRFFVAMVSHETNTFSPIRTDRRQFELHDLRYGGELLEAYRGTGTCLGGMIDTAEARGVALVPSLAATASPAGRVSRILRGGAQPSAGRSEDGGTAGRRAARPARGHGGGRCRRRRGRSARGRPGRRGLGADRGDAGLPRQRHARDGRDGDAAARLPRPTRTWTWTRGAARPPPAWPTWRPGGSGPPSPTASCPCCRRSRASSPRGADAPALRPRRCDGDAAARAVDLDLRRVPAGRHPRRRPVDLRGHRRRRRARRGACRGAGERRRGRCGASSCTPRCRWRTRWRARWRSTAPRWCWPTSPTTPAAAPAATRPRSCASCCGSAPRRTTVACLWDEAAVRACLAAGVGSTITLDVGGKVDPSHGAPLTVTGRVRTLSDGRFVYKGPMFRGLEGRVGPTAVLDVNDVKIILISNRRQTLDPEMIRFVGIDPTAEKILVVKSSIHYRAAFEPLAARHPRGRCARVCRRRISPASRSRACDGPSSRSTTCRRRQGPAQENIDGSSRVQRLGLQGASTRRASSRAWP